MPDACRCVTLRERRRVIRAAEVVVEQNDLDLGTVGEIGGLVQGARPLFTRARVRDADVARSARTA
jgi:hypothetical protein